MKHYKRHISQFEIAAAVILIAVFLTAVVARLAYGSDLSLLIGIIAGCLVVYGFLLLTPLSYEFEGTDLVLINPKPLRSKRICCADIIKYDTVGTFRMSKKDFDTVEVILYYRIAEGKRKRSVSCHPKNVTEFVKTLQECCPNLIMDME